MKKRKALYPGNAEAELEKRKAQSRYHGELVADFLGNAPNYDAFPGWSAERVLAWLNID